MPGNSKCSCPVSSNMEDYHIGKGEIPGGLWIQDQTHHIAGSVLGAGTQAKMTWSVPSRQIVCKFCDEFVPGTPEEGPIHYRRCCWCPVQVSFTRCTHPLVAMNVGYWRLIVAPCTRLNYIPPKFTFFLEPQNVTIFGNTEGLCRCNLLR